MGISNHKTELLTGMPRITNGKFKSKDIDARQPAVAVATYVLEARSRANNPSSSPEDHSMKRIFAVLSFLVLAISLATAQLLPEIASPENYKLTFTPDLEN